MSTDVETTGTLTHAISAPLAEVKVWISWLSLVVPSALVNRMSLPLACALAARLASVPRLINTGKLIRLAPPLTRLWSIVISLRYAQLELYQAAMVGASLIPFTVIDAVADWLEYAVAAPPAPGLALAGMALVEALPVVWSQALKPKVAVSPLMLSGM